MRRAKHPIHGFAELGVLRNRLDVAGHGFARLGRVLMRVALGQPPAAKQKFEPVGALAVSSKLAAADQVALAQDPAQRVVGVEHEHRAHPRA